MSILEFIFQSGWHFMGTIVLIYCVLGGLAEIAEAWRKK